MVRFLLTGIWGIGVGLLLLSCTTMTSSQPLPPSASLLSESSPSQVVAQDNRAQQLPITARADIAGQMIDLEVTRTPEQQATGLMFRSRVPDNQGMLFSFNPPRPVRFWMLNVQVPLDMVFLRNGDVKAIAANVPPCQASPCPTYGPNTQIDQVIELRGGRAAELGLRVGDRVTITFLEASTSPNP